MPSRACGCYCNVGRPPREDLENGRRTERTTTTPEKDPVNEVVFTAVHRITKFIARGLLILLWVYLYNSMKRYAISYIGKDTWFSTFVVIAVAVPITEFFCIVGQIATTPPPRSFDLWPRPFPRRK